MLRLQILRVIKQHFRFHSVLKSAAFGLSYRVLSSVDTKVSKKFAAFIMEINVSRASCPPV